MRGCECRGLFVYSLAVWAGRDGWEKVARILRPGLARSLTLDTTQQRQGQAAAALKVAKMS